MEWLDGFETWKDLLNAAIHVLQGLITAGIGFRCILIIRSGREEEQPWSKIWIQLKKHIYIVIITLVLSELVAVINAYFVEAA